ncbi:unnamed protein product [Cyprideis torosa]|uniref:Uncharacterized protein n=1 Tax=Cyprideis torosa TaxID=163714 RepID=A0A7R8WDD3_9CRUS|nr:unnamed protein product [Cyprideis torosa]CAG0894591.1 unnamed protein product [Cyprideis torosa]
MLLPKALPVSVLLLLPSPCLSQNVSRSVYQRIEQKIFTDYDPTIPPPIVSENGDEPIDVQFGLQILKAIVDENDHILWMNVWLRMIYEDKRLQWNDTQFQNVKLIWVQPKKLWMPDITLYHEMPQDHSYASMIHNIEGVDAQVQHNGSVSFFPPVKMGAICTFDYWNWPHDIQPCRLKFGSWMYHGSFLKLKTFVTNEKVINERTYQPGDWTLVENSSAINTMFYAESEHPFINIDHHLLLYRNPDVYRYTVFVPIHMSVILMLVGILFAPGTAFKYCSFVVNLSILIGVLWSNQDLAKKSARAPRIFAFIAVCVALHFILFIVDGIFYTLRSTRKPLPHFIHKVCRPCDHSTPDTPMDYSRSFSQTSSVDSTTARLSEGKTVVQREQLSRILQWITFILSIAVIIVLYCTLWPVPANPVPCAARNSDDIKCVHE